jgi:hypothetical protein
MIMKKKTPINQKSLMQTSSSLLLYTTQAGNIEIEVRLENETVWLTQADMAELFQTTPQNITLHLKAIYAEGELKEDATCKEYLQVQSEGQRQTERLNEYLVKGFTMDDELLKAGVNVGR